MNEDKWLLEKLNPINVTHRSFNFPNTDIQLEPHCNPLTIKDKVLIWIDVKFPRFMLFRMRMKGWKI